MFSLSKSVVVLGLSVLLALEGIQEEERQSSVCVLSEGKFFPVVGKIFLKFDQKVLNFRKFEWFTDGQLENFFLSSGKFFLVVGKNFFCRKEGLGMPEGFDKPIYFIELPEPSLVSSVKIKSAFTLLV